MVRRHAIPQTTVWTILKNPIYAGTIRYAGCDHPGKHQPILTPTEYTALQAALPPDEPRHRTCPRAQTAHAYLLASLLKCRCGASMHTASAVGRGGKRYAYCVCPKCNQRLKAPEAEEAVLTALSQVSYAPAEIARAVAVLHHRRAAALRRATPALAALDDDERRLQADVAAIDLAVLSGLLTAASADHYNAKLASCHAALAAIQGRRAALLADQSPASEWVLLEQQVQAVSNLGQVLRHAADDPARLRQVLLKRVTTVVQDDNGGLRITLAAGGDGSSVREIGCPAWTRTKTN